jgi:radical SAM protein with 4Fe4S-binding SPASM domain
MVVRPTGEISLCCNDALGKITLGNVNDNTLEEIWYGLEYQKVREQLRKGRHKSNIELCVTCDTVSL